MKVKSAAEAVQVVKDFLDKFTTLGFVPTCANKEDNKWLIEGKIGFTRMSFEIDSDTGEIMSFCECKSQ